MLYQLSHFRSMADRVVGAESQIRTGDTAIFSRVLYQLSYLGELFCCYNVPHNWLNLIVKISLETHFENLALYETSGKRAEFYFGIEGLSSKV